MRKAGAMLLGFGVGLGMTLLYVPQSGEAFRRRITRKADDAVGKVTEAVNEAVQPLVTAVEEAEAVLKDAVDRKEIPSVAEVIGTAKDAYEGQKAWQQATEDVAPLEKAS
jgi:hypothetical protein